MITDEVLKAVGLIGLGGLLKSLVDFAIASTKAKHDSRHAFKEVRYKAIILLCYALVYYDREETKLIVNRPDIRSAESLKNELHVEFINMSLYGSDSVIFKMKDFLENPNKQALANLALAMRKDLYGIRTGLKESHLDFKMVE
jgi:hypothetical protein